MPNETSQDLVKEILHRLEMKDIVNIEELIYLHNQAKEHPEVDRWVRKLLSAEKFNIEYVEDEIA